MTDDVQHQSVGFKEVVWLWLPGLVAGFIPLLVFLVVSAVASPSSAIKSPAWWASFYEGASEHLLVLAMVTSAVSTFTSFPRLFTMQRGEAALGQASLILVVVITLNLIFSVAMYVMTEAHVNDSNSLLSGGLIIGFLLALAAAITSFYVEVTIANHRLKGLRVKVGTVRASSETTAET